MALVWLDGFDLYDSDADVQRRYALDQTGDTSQAASGGRFGGGAVETVGVNASGMTFQVAAAGATVVLGVALKLAQTHNGGSDASPALINFKDSGGVAHVTITFDTATRALKAMRGTSGGTLLATGATPLALDAWHFVEVKVTVDDSAGAVEVRLNGAAAADLSFAGDTRNAGVAGVSSIGLYSIGPNAGKRFTLSIDDIYVLDASGPSNNDFLGDVRVSTLRPSADTAQRDFTRSTGSTNYSLVDEANSDNADTDYVESSTVGHKDLYDYSDLPAGAQGVKAVQVASVARKDDAGARTSRAVLKSGATTANGATRSLSTGYALGLDLLQADPATGAAWGVAAVNALQAGYEVVS